MSREEQNESLVTTHISPVAATSTFTHHEWDVLQLLRRRYHDDQDLWNARELAHLRFYRWLREAGRIES